MRTAQVRRELEALQAADPQRMLRPKKCLQWARSHRRSALHEALEWDDRKAGELYRLDQIRNLIKLVIVDLNDGTPQVYSLSIDRTVGGGYRRVDDIVASSNLSAVLLEDALRELERMQVRYARVQALTSVWVAASRVRSRTRRRRATPRPRPRAAKKKKTATRRTRRGGRG